MTRLLVTGASGLLGLNLSLLAVEQGYQVLGWVNANLLTHTSFPIQQIDLCNLSQIRERISVIKPDVIVHCAALAHIDLAEARPEWAMRINAEAAGEIARVAAEDSIPMIHISTDAVFDGQKGNYIESDVPSPISIYAKSKLAGEEAVNTANPDAIIARVNFYGWSISGQRSLGEFFFYNLQAGHPVKGFTDVVFCPLYVAQLAQILLEMVKKQLHGLYHVLSSEHLSKYDFGCAIARKFDFNESLITPISVQEAGLSAARSPNLTMQVEKLEHDLGHSLPNQARGLDAFFEAYQAGLPARIKSFL